MRYLLLLLFIFPVHASERHHDHTTTNNTYITESGSQALSLGAAAIDFTYSTKSLQLGGGVGFHNDKSALVIGIGKRFDDTLFKATFGKSGSDYGGNVGVVITIK